MRRGAQQVACALASVVGLAGCDSFDFGRLLGGEVPPVPSASTSAVPAVPAPVEAARAEKLTVVIGGDVDATGLLLPPGRDASSGAVGPFAPVRVLFDGGVRLVHLVSPLTAQPLRRRSGHRGPAATGELLAALGVDSVAVANGHAWDAGKQGFLETLGVFRDLGLSVTGGGRDEAETFRPTELLAEGWSVALFSVTGSWPYGPLQHHEASGHVARYDEPRLLDAVKRAKKSSDLVLVTIHGGIPLVDAVLPEEEAQARALVEAGADAVVISGASLPRRIGWTAGRPVFFGLGNLLGGDGAAHPWARRGIVVRVTYRDGQRPVVEACPYLVEAGVPVRLAGSKRVTQEQIFTRGLERLSEGDGGSRIGTPRRYGCMSASPLSEKSTADSGP